MNLMKEKITAIYFESKQRYGSPRITIELNKISHLTVVRQMKQLGLQSKLSKKFKVTTDSKHSYLMVEKIFNIQFYSKPSKT